LEYIKHVLFPLFGKFEVVWKEEDGGNKTFLSMTDLTADYESGVLQPADVKQALEKAINITLQPIRDHFASSAELEKIFKAMQCY
jgi:tyrosyl-tRNA synthetase